jgi:hypothetical protein
LFAIYFLLDVFPQLQLHFSHGDLQLLPSYVV